MAILEKKTGKKQWYKYLYQEVRRQTEIKPNRKKK